MNADIKLVVMDFDNTIFNYDYAYKMAVDKVLSKLAEYTKTDITFLHTRFQECKKRIANRMGDNCSKHDKMLQFKELVESFNHPLITDRYALIAELSGLYSATILDNLVTYPFLYDFLDACKRRGIKLSILTNNTFNSQLAIFNKLGLHKYFDGLYTSHEIGYQKPNPKAFTYVVEQYNIDRKNIMFIGDSYENDYKGALDSGLNAIWFKDSYIDMTASVNSLK